MKDAIDWVDSKQHNIFTINFDSLSNLPAIEDISTCNLIVNDIIKALQKTTKIILFMLVHGRAGIAGNDQSDSRGYEIFKEELAKIPPILILIPENKLTSALLNS